MAARFNPPPNWPKPPEGFTPGPGWSPDPSWGPAPAGWQLWVDDPIASPASIPGNDPSSPSPFPSDASVSSASAGASSPYAPGGSGRTTSASPPHSARQNAPLLQTQAPAAANQPCATPPAAGSPTDAGNPYTQFARGSMPSYAQANAQRKSSTNRTVGIVLGSVVGIFFITIALAVIGILNPDDEEDPTAWRGSDPGWPTSAFSETPNEVKMKDGSSLADSLPSGTTTEKFGFSAKSPADPQLHYLTMYDSEVDSSGLPITSIDVELGAVDWNAGPAILAELTEEGIESLYTEPDAGEVWIRVPVTITYHGEDTFNSFDLDLTYFSGDSFAFAEYSYTDSDFFIIDMPGDGQTATGYLNFMIDEEDATAQQGTFEVSAFYATPSLFMSAK